MRRVVPGWLRRGGLAALILTGVIGAVLNPLSATGLVLLMLCSVVLVRRGWAGLSLLLFAVMGRLAIERWEEASGVAVLCARSAVPVGLLVALGMVLPTLITREAVGLAVLAPPAVAVGLRVFVFSPLSAHLRAGHVRWSAALLEALVAPAEPLPPLIGQRIRGVA